MICFWISHNHTRKGWWWTLKWASVCLFLPSRTGCCCHHTSRYARNATVSYSIAAAPYLEFIEVNSGQVSHIPRSIYISVFHLEFQHDGDTLIFTKAACLVDDVVVSDDVAGLCLMPLKSTVIPTQWSLQAVHGVYEFIKPLFTSDMELLALMWCVGNAITGPIDTSKFAILYGGGGNGKSTVIKCVESAL